jgi:hypothetical protein
MARSVTVDLAVVLLVGASAFQLYLAVRWTALAERWTGVAERWTGINTNEHAALPAPAPEQVHAALPAPEQVHVALPVHAEPMSTTLKKGRFTVISDHHVFPPPSP